MNTASHRLPALFIGHGNPMNALASNEYTEAWRKLGDELKSRVRSVVIVSAHWATRDGLAVTTAERPGVLYDFFGFPDALSQVQYDCPGHPELARHIQRRFSAFRAAGAQVPEVQGDPQRALDHGVWSILTHMFPDADVPVVQLSYNMNTRAAGQIALGRALVEDLSDQQASDEDKFTNASLRDQGVLLLTSGNIVHNLREIDFDPHSPPHDWALEFDAAVQARLDQGPGEIDALLAPEDFGEAGRLAVPTLDHYIPFLNFLGMAASRDRFDYPCEGIQNRSISMRAVRCG
ncbi:MAG: dioxygenase [bacterium]|nr:dioxygenase [bacterium]